MQQYKGIDTKVEQFAPSRANPVARRTVRKYYAQQPLTGTSIFENLTFQIEQTDPKNVINEMRLVFPLEMRAYGLLDSDTDGEDHIIELPMHTNCWKRSSNIAVGQNAPFSAFRNLEIALNGKVYTQQFQSYGKTLGQCFQSYSEMQFANDESLKPVANNFLGVRGIPRETSIRNTDGSVRRVVNITPFEPQPNTFSLLENNSGFLARARRFLNFSLACWKAASVICGSGTLGGIATVISNCLPMLRFMNSLFRAGILAFFRIGLGFGRVFRVSPGRAGVSAVKSIVSRTGMRGFFITGVFF